MVKNLSRVSNCLILGCLLGLVLSDVGISQTPTKKQLTNKRGSICSTNLETLTNLMLKDLPSYANRVMQRSRGWVKSPHLGNYVIIAGKPEFDPLVFSQEPSQYPPLFPDTAQQVFFTTLERQYNTDRMMQVQNFHWLFLTQTDQGWQLVMSFTQLGTAQGQPLPRQDTTNGVIGQAVRLWLRDCNAGVIK